MPLRQIPGGVPPPVGIDLSNPAGLQGEAGEGDRVIALEWATAGSAGGFLLGDAGANRLLGGIGNDLLSGGGGSDVLMGGFGHDFLSAGSGDDVLDVQDEGADDVACGAGIDRIGVDAPYAFYFPDEDEFTTVDPKDEIDSDCERVQLVSDFGDPLMAAVAPRTVRARAITFENPCRPRRCRGEVRLRYGSPSRLAGRRSFGQRSSRVVVRPSPAAGRRLARGRPLRVSVRWTFVLADQFRDSRYRTTYRSSLAVPPATAPP